ncbi:hypothetical protein TSUD_412980 [Trifolium subterraneum]|uniref:F-box domain-containing protein n=1 Tax=Trifolium subterraneum TaxID=3900 RepID=A0A2Z6PIR8_TRISU|nr:hypothetical protein TSUD_412980 [Trifolium subterraneum]
MDIFLLPNQEELRKYYHHHPLTFYFCMNPTVSIPGICINYIPLSKVSVPCFGSHSSQSKSVPNIVFGSFGCQSSESKYESKVISRNCIPDDVAFSILSKLSIKSLKRFGCVCKSWSILFESTYFMTMYSKHFISHHGSHDDYHTFILANHRDDDGDGLYHSEFHLLENRLKLNLPSPLQPYPKITCILGSTSVNGIFCLGQQPFRATQKSLYVLWNPLTEEFKVIPPSPAELTPLHLGDDEEHMFVAHNFHGFGYDQIRDDFKVIQYVSFECSFYGPTSFFEIYSLKSNSWRMIHMDEDLCRQQHNFYSLPFNGLEVYVDGACHWLVSRSINHQDALTLLSFDLSDELFLTTLIGEEPHSRYAICRRLTVLNGSIALISNYHDDVVFHISILGELGVSESWIKLYIYGPLPSIQWPPIGFGKMGYMFIRKKDYEVAYVDLSTQIIDEVGIITDGYRSNFMCGLYKESLLSIGGSSN